MISNIADNGEVQMTGEELKQAGISRVLDSAEKSWKQTFCLVAVQLLQTKGSFTAEEVVALVGHPPEERFNSIGGTMSRLNRTLKGLITIKSFEKSVRPSCHSRMIPRWGWRE